MAGAAARHWRGRGRRHLWLRFRRHRVLLLPRRRARRLFEIDTSSHTYMLAVIFTPAH